MGVFLARTLFKNLIFVFNTIVVDIDMKQVDIDIEIDVEIDIDSDINYIPLIVLQLPPIYFSSLRLGMYIFLPPQFLSINRKQIQ